ncbi:MAG: Stk1 family PASTA domain-containing Ser/Thr kinase [Micromonosporaceae bacterium]
MTQQARLLGGRYQLGDLLGYGGMAEVHLGRDLRLGRDVAIKVLRVDLARDATFQARFRREAQNAASLNHPAIVAVYDTGEERGDEGVALPYIVMEYVNGRTLKEVLTAESRVMPRRALEIVADTCAALDFSHRHGIIHRDIKPGNVMLTKAGQVKVMDFGIARALASGTSTMTATSAVIGTAQYLSPEQARGEAVDARSDVYATGCVLYELMCGQPPFTGDNPVSVAYQHVREAPKPPSDNNSDVSPDVDAVVLKALSKNPVNRYQTAGEMRADLLRAAAGRPVEATPVMSADEVTQYLGAGPGRHASRPAAGVPDRARRRATNWVLVALAMLAVFALVALGTGIWLNGQNPSIEVPNLVGDKASDAERTLEGKDLQAETRNEHSPDCAKGTVTEQDPQQGTMVDEGQTVILTVCQGPDTVDVPNVVALDAESAKIRLKNRNLKFQLIERDSARDEGEVLRTTPPAGRSVKEGSTVKLYVSRGNLVPVPNVVGMSREEARRTLRDAGFSVRVVERPADQGEQPNTVASQTPGPEENAPTSSTVKITVVVPPDEPTTSPSPSPSDSGLFPNTGHRGTRLGG